jgi:hypothetical protein
MKFAVVLLTVAAALAVALPAAADPPTVRHFQDVFVDVNPCTGLDHTVTVDVTVYSPVPDHTGHATHTITTSDGFVGRGEEVGIFDDTISQINDTLVNPDTGQRIRAQLIVIANPTTGDLQVLRSTVTCIPPGSA